MKKVSNYQFLKGLNQKIPQKVLEEEYSRLYKNLKRSVYGYVKRGISTSFFRLPAKPKKITQASIRALQKNISEWKYYTGRKLTSEEYKSLPSNISRAGKHNISDLSRMARTQSRVSAEIDEAISQYRKDLEEKIAEKNSNNPDYQKMIDEGYFIGDIPDSVTNEALGLYIMSENVYYEATDALAKGDRTRNWWFIQLKAETAMSSFTNMGVQEYGRLYSFNIQHNKQGMTYSEITDILDEALYDSEQLDHDGRFSNILNCMIGDPRKLNAEERRQYDEIREALGLT